MPGLMSGDWKRGTVSGPQRLQCDAWTAPDLSTTAPALDSTPRLSIAGVRLTDAAVRQLEVRFQAWPFCDIWPCASMLWPSSAIVSTIRWEKLGSSRDHVHTLSEIVQRYSRETLRTSKYSIAPASGVASEDRDAVGDFWLVDMRLEEQKCTGLQPCERGAAMERLAG